MSKKEENYDGRWYFCPLCRMKKSLRFGSFTEEFKCTLMEIIRIIFFYFCRGYTVDVVFKELCANSMAGRGGIGMAK